MGTGRRTSGSVERDLDVAIEQADEDQTDRGQARGKEPDGMARR